MAISSDKYVDITSGVAGTAEVAARDLIGRIFTTNPLVPTGSVIEFSTLESVGDYFGTSSEEYERAQLYFGWVSKSITSPDKISYANWAKTATAPRIYGAKGDKTLSDFTAVTNGSLTITIGDTTLEITGINMSTDTSLSEVATTVEDAINADGYGEPFFETATVSYDAVSKRFNFVASSTGPGAISITNVSGDDVATLLEWDSATAILSDGSAAQTVTEVLADSTELSNNFATFLFMPDLSDDEKDSVASWNDAQNNMFMYCLPVTSSDAATQSSALLGYSGTGMTLEYESEYQEMMPMIIAAATRYDRPNSTQNYMYQKFPSLTATVTTTNNSTTYDNLRVNYLGATQQAGNELAFYQRGVLTGGTNDATDMNTYVNEIWLKDQAKVAILNLFLALPTVSANTEGVAQILAALQAKIDDAIDNGVISVGKTLNETQKQSITSLSNDERAWQQVQNIGYWVDAVIESYVTDDSRTEYKCVYTLIYAKDDAVRKVEGSHILI